MTLARDTRRRSAPTAALGVLAAAAVTWLAAEVVVALLDRLGLGRPSVLALVTTWTPLLLLATPLGRERLARGGALRPRLTPVVALSVVWAGCAALLVPEVFPVAAAGAAHVVLQTRPRRGTLLLLLGVLWAGTAAVAVGTAAAGLPSMMGAAAADVLLVVVLLLVTAQVVSSAALARAALDGARALAERERQRVEELRVAATHDPLTAALNRRGLLEGLGAALAAPSCGTALVFLDLDGFKAVNDAHGHDVGDELLVALSARLRTALRQAPRQDDLLARLGGDEFVVVLREVETEAVLERVVERLRRAVTAPVTTSAGEVGVGVSIGTALTAGAVDGRAACTAEVLLRLADERMYGEKRTRRRAAAPTR